MTRRRMTVKRRETIYDRYGGCCADCGLSLAGKVWHADHIQPLEISGDDSEANLQPLCQSCHAAKTGRDVQVIAKVRRQRAAHKGIKRKTRALPGGRDSKWKRKISGEVVER